MQITNIATALERRKEMSESKKVVVIQDCPLLFEYDINVESGVVAESLYVSHIAPLEFIKGFGYVWSPVSTFTSVLKLIICSGVVDTLNFIGPL